MSKPKWKNVFTLSKFPGWRRSLWYYASDGTIWWWQRRNLGVSTIGWRPSPDMDLGNMEVRITKSRAKKLFPKAFNKLPERTIEEQLQEERAARGALQLLYDDLIFGVARKFPGETLHQTALRYIHETEQRANDPSPSMISREA